MGKSYPSKSRRFWVGLSWLCTLFLPTFIIGYLIGRSSDKTTNRHRVQAWREKVTLCVIVLFLSLCLIFSLWFFGSFLCPDCKVMSLDEFHALNSSESPHVVIYGRIFDLLRLERLSQKNANILSFYAGRDASEIFPQDIFNRAMAGIGAISIYSPASRPPVSPYFPLPFLSSSSSLPELSSIPSNLLFGENNANSDFSFEDIDLSFSKHPFEEGSLEMMGLLEALANSWVADVGWSTNDLIDRGSSKDSPIISIDGILFNVSEALKLSNKIPKTEHPTNYTLLLSALTSLPWSGFDHSSQLLKLYPQKEELFQAIADLSAIIGIIDPRSPFQCILGRRILFLAASIILFIALVKFLAALQLGRRRHPEVPTRHVILQLTCFTENETAIRKSIDSLVTTNYSDNCKLLWVICDGIATGVGNDRSTAQILLDIFSKGNCYEITSQGFVDNSHSKTHILNDGSSFLYDTIGEQNKAKLWMGHYEHIDYITSIRRTVPFVLIIKTGSEYESDKPYGNRGKRDSQLVLLRWLSKLHRSYNAYNLPISNASTFIDIDDDFNPLEQALEAGLCNYLGIDPLAFEYLLMLDADTQCAPDSLTRLVAAMVGDQKLVGICGETTLANPRASWVTAIQVYEYFITHHYAKSFESLFGVVTCLPGCFSLFRLRNGAQLLLVSPSLLSEYGRFEEDSISERSSAEAKASKTLHRRNLLALGEDRYLTTLLLKHFPQHKTAFEADAICMTSVPETWKVLLSQRRRWINSTVHNLWELLSIPQSCGFGSLALKVVVFLDLYSTLVMPATIIYLFWCLYMAMFENASSKFTSVPNSALSLTLAFFVMQTMICILKRRWYAIGWMFLYILTLPFYCFILPLYAFWHFDDFTWGKTRKQRSFLSTTLVASKCDAKNAETMPLFGRRYSATILTSSKAAHANPYFYSFSHSQLKPYATTNYLAPVEYSASFAPHHSHTYLQLPASSASQKLLNAKAPQNAPSEAIQLVVERTLKHILLLPNIDSFSLNQIREMVEQEASVDLSMFKPWFSSLIEFILAETINSPNSEP